MNLEELNNNISILLKPYDNKELTPRQQHAKDTVLACQTKIHELVEEWHRIKNVSSINFAEAARRGLEAKIVNEKNTKLKKELEALKKANEELTEQNEELKKNLGQCI